MGTLRYGVFLVGDLWTVSNSDRPLMCFSNRADALRAGERLVKINHDEGHAAELHVMDVGGELTRASSQMIPFAASPLGAEDALAMLARPH
jgi:hypothetical protein